MHSTDGRVRRGQLIRVIITTVAVATAGLVLIAPDASAGSGTVDDTTVASRDLLATVPFSVRPTCAVDDPTDSASFAGYGAAAAALTATLACAPDGVDSAYYDRFDDPDSMQAAFDLSFPASDEASGFGKCPSRTEYRSGGKRAGIVTCRIGVDDAGRPRAGLAFTYAPDSTIVWALGPDADAVWSFFEDDAGPLAKADFREIAPLPTSARLDRAAAKLEAHLPKQARETCIRVNNFTPDNLQSFYPYRLAIVADVEECRFDGGIEAEYLQFTSKAAAEHILSLSDFTGTQIASYKSFSCPGSGSYKGGRWGCKITRPTVDGVPGDEIATVAWTTDALRTYSYGQAPVADAAALLEWFADTAGPTP